MSHEFPAEHWVVKKQPLSGHCYLRHLESGKEFLRAEDARKLAMTLPYYSPPPNLAVNPAAKFRNLPLIARDQFAAIAQQFPAADWEVRRSNNCQYYFKHLKTNREVREDEGDMVGEWRQERGARQRRTNNLLTP